MASTLRARLQLGDLSVLEPARPPLTFQSYAEGWLESYAVPHTKPRTQEIYRLLCRLHLFPILGTPPLTEITREKARALFAEKVVGGMKRTTALKVLALLREVLNHAVDDGHIQANPATRLSRFYRGYTEAEARSQIIPLTEAELTTLLAACRRWYPDHLELIATAAWAGLRQGEILGLQWEDIDFASRFVEVRRTVGYRGGRLLVGSPKSGRARRVDLANPLVAWLQARKSLHEAEAAVQGRDLISWVYPTAWASQSTP